MEAQISVNITSIQTTAAANCGQVYFWRLILDSGKEVDQFDPITGQEQPFPDWVEWVSKSELDPYYHQPAFKKIKTAFWIPANGDGEAHYVHRDNAHSIVLFRKQYRRLDGSSGPYTVYCIGQRWEGDNSHEAVYHICPPARYLSSVGVTKNTYVIFPGGVSLLTSPLAQNLFDQLLSTAKNP